MIGRTLFAIALALTATTPAFGDYKTCMTFCMEQYDDFDHCHQTQCSKSSFKADSTPTPKVEAALTAPTVGALAIPSAYDHKYVLQDLNGWLAHRGLDLDDAALAEYISVGESEYTDLKGAEMAIAAARFHAKLAGQPDPVGPAVERAFAQIFESEGCWIPRTNQCLRVSGRWWLGGIAFRTDWTNICDKDVVVSGCHKYDDGGPYRRPVDAVCNLPVSMHASHKLSASRRWCPFGEHGAATVGTGPLPFPS